METSDAGTDLVLIAKYLNQEADVHEMELVENWIAESDQNREEFQKLKKAWELASAGIGTVEWSASSSKERLLLKLIEAQSKAIKNSKADSISDKADSLNSNETPTFSMSDTLSGSQNSINQIRIVTPSKQRLGFKFLKYAAIILFLLAPTSILVFKFLSDKRAAAFPGKNFTEIAASRGSKINMTLEDGSQVVLNAGSTLKYGSDFNIHQRDIYLVGEAYFEVAKNPSKPFNVHAGDIIVHAIGTVFNVKAYPEDPVVETTLVEGSVSVEVKNGSAHKMILQPREQVYYYKPDLAVKEKEKILISKGIETEEYTSWINGELTINNETLESLVVKLERKYDVAFHFGDESLKGLRYTGVLRNETIEQILDILKISSPLTYRMEKREIWISRN